MAKYIDQAIFDGTVLVLGSIGVIEIEKHRKSRIKFDVDNFAISAGCIQPYAAMRPEDVYFPSQVVEVLKWALAASPIQLTSDEYSTALKEAFDIRAKLNAEMQPLKVWERISKGMIFQPENYNYLNRVSQAKVNIATILTRCSVAHQNNFNKLADFERRLRLGSLENFLTKHTGEIKAQLTRKYTEINWETEFHFHCYLASRCYWSLVKRFKNFPNYSAPLSSAQIATSIEEALVSICRSRIEPSFVARIFDAFVSMDGELNDDYEGLDERRIWTNLGFDISNTYWWDDEAVKNYFCNCQEDIIDYVYRKDVDFEAIGIDFLG